MSATVDSLRALADELQIATATPKTADASILNCYRIHAMHIRAIEREVIKARRQEERDRRDNWLDNFAHGIYVMELHWARLLAGSATHRVGVSIKRVRRHVEGAA
jgi:hypothetical protein